MLPIRIRCYHFNRAFKVTFNSPQTKRHQADSVIVRIDCSDGTAGFGESAPRPYVTGEDYQSVTNLIVDSFAPILFNHSINSIDSIQTTLNQLEAVCRQMGIGTYNSALGAIDLALLDAIERSQRIPPDHLFPVEHREALRFSVSVPFLPLDLITAYFPLFKTHVDISVIKILVSEDITETFERVKLIRHLANPGTEFRLEFNGKMAFSRVIKTLERLTPLDISAIEQPLPSGHLKGLHQLRDQFGLNLVADESLVTFEDAEYLARNSAFDIFNIKVSKCGGLLQSMRIAKLADQHGIQCQVGTHVGESELLGIAGRRLARSLPNFDCYGGGSEILFSRLFESHKQTAASAWPPPANRDTLKNKACRDLILKRRLLADTGLRKTS
jgi:L-alanine-DL-glutamate epimerase-like enolase superfamily enzyme